MESEEVTLRSDDTNLMKEDQHTKQMITLKYPINVSQRGGALSIVTIYPFSEL